MFEPMALERRVLDPDLFRRLHGRMDAGCVVRKRHFCTVRSYWRERFLKGNKTEKLSDEPPADQEHRPRDRADQAHRVQLSARSISFASLPDDLSFVELTSQFSFCSPQCTQVSFPHKAHPTSIRPCSPRKRSRSRSRRSKAIGSNIRGVMPVP